MTTSRMQSRQGTDLERYVPPLHIDLNMDFGEKSKVMEVLNKAHGGSVVTKHTASAAIREFEGMLDELYRQPPSWDMVTMHRDEVDKMKEIIKYQEQKIRELTERVSNGNLSTYPLPAVPELEDTQRRYDLADRFNALYENEWNAAYEELRYTMKWKDIECIYALMRVIRNACDLCLTLAEDQLDKILANMEDCMKEPLRGKGGRFRQNSNTNYTEAMRGAVKHARAYRQQRAEASVPSVIELFVDTKLRAIINPFDVRKEFKSYTRKCVELIWLMTTLDPPMRLFWQQQTERVNEDFFNYFERKGDFVNQTVWPAVFLHNTGVMLYKGKTLAM